MKAAHHLLIVSPEHSSHQSPLRQLALYDELVIAWAGSATEAMRLLADNNHTAVLVDAPLPDLDEAAFCRQVRRQGTRTPVLVLGSGNDAAVILALEAGAIDYLVKPVRANLLMARLRAHLRQYEQCEAASIPMGPFVLRVGEKVLLDIASGKEIRLTARETDLLKYLHRAGDRTVSQSRLLTDVWGYHASVDTHTVQTHVHRLRRKIGDDRRTGKLIVTDGHGYRLASADAQRSAA
ncbi:MAG TPA: response regulator transcription factor [Stellaceae bacterium]|nr:response regulator transcription factor [Stellaceae bacterium]